MRKLKYPPIGWIYNFWNDYYPDDKMPQKGFILLHKNKDRWDNRRENLIKVKDKRTYRNDGS